MTTGRALSRMNSTPGLLLAGACLRGLLDWMRCTMASGQCWPDGWGHHALFYSGIVILGLAVAARWRPVAAAILSVLLQFLMMIYFYRTVKWAAAYWILPEIAVFALLAVACGLAIRGARRCRT